MIDDSKIAENLHRELDDAKDAEYLKIKGDFERSIRALMSLPNLVLKGNKL